MRGWASQFLADPRPWLVLAGLVALAAVAARPLARRTGQPVWLALATLLAAAVILTLTLPPAPGHPIGGPTTAGLVDCVAALTDPAAWWHGMVDTGNRGERVGNVLMFVPLGFFAALLTRRPGRVALVGLVAPAVIEVSQALIGGGRDCAADDWLNNATGAVLGATAGAMLLRQARTRSDRD